MTRNTSGDNLISFLNRSPSPYHAAETASYHLLEGGAQQLDESSPAWSSLKPGGSAFIVRGGGSIAAVRIPTGFSAERPLPFHIAVAHTDSPCLRLKARPAESTHGYRQWGVEVYGGALFNSWLDRDLGIAGRVHRVGSSPGTAKLIRMEDHPIRIPQLAIHLERTVNEQGLILNPQKHLVPITGQSSGPSLESLLENAAGAPFTELAFDLCLYDRTPACYGGTCDEFIYSGRLDNQAMCHAALAAFVDAPAGDAIQVMVLFDHEEIGSVSAQGAESNLLVTFLERIALSLGLTREAWLSLLPRSFIVSADMAHGIHPNYPDRHEPDHFPQLNKGVVLKSNAGLRYASDGFSSARFLGWARRAGVETQRFINRTDLGCGTTVGPGLSAQLGIPTVDAGTPMLSMHSAREMCGAGDHGQMISVLKAFYLGG